MKYRLKELIDDETLELKRGELEHPRHDDELRQQVQALWKQNASRRTITAARQALGIPSWHRRAGRPIYPPPGFDFSLSRPLTPEGVLAHAPSGPGVYEIASSGTEIAYPHRASAVIYLGRSGNLRNRLRTHRRNHTKFEQQIGDGRPSSVLQPSAVVAFESRGQLMRSFCEMHGALPCYNMVMPSGVLPPG